MKEKIERLLLKAVSPARYAGGEWNVAEPKPNAPLQFLMCFPDAYEVGYSNLGIKILDGMLNARTDASSEFCFAPMPDMGGLMRQNGIPLFSLSSRTPAKNFDMLGFSLSYELSYTNVLYMLDLAGIPFYADERTEQDPILIAGGACTVNPAPVSPFFDLICVGDGEDALSRLADIFIANKQAGGDKRSFLEQAGRIEGVFAPNLGNYAVKRAAVQDLDHTFYPVKLPVPNTESIHNRAMLELFRGCGRGCRFCQAGFIGRPVRARSVEKLIQLSKDFIAHTGYEEISLSSLSSCDYPHLRRLLAGIKPVCEQSGVRISLPSTRVDSFEAEYTETARKGSLTFAPEAGTQRLRDVINKNVTEDDILTSCRRAFEKGYASVKLYFMIGLPTETDEDIDGIVALAKKIKYVYKTAAKNKKSLLLGVSVSTFVPKPFTPFQWEKQLSLPEIQRIQARLRDGLKPLGIRFSSHDAGVSKTEAVLARGNASLANIIEKVYRAGGKFDGWTEYFSFDLWQSALTECGMELESLTDEIPQDAPLAWDNIDVGVSREFLLGERALALECKVSAGCESGCRNCGIASFDKAAFNRFCKMGNDV